LVSAVRVMAKTARFSETFERFILPIKNFGNDNSFDIKLASVKVAYFELLILYGKQ
jgi:hypothetical protein